MLRIQAPDHAGSRDQVADLVQALPDDLSVQDVLLDCSRLVVGTPSFFDEVVKQVLERRHAATLDVHAATQRSRELLERAAENRSVRDRLRIAIRVS